MLALGRALAMAHIAFAFIHCEELPGKVRMPTPRRAAATRIGSHSRQGEVQPRASVRTHAKASCSHAHPFRTPIGSVWAADPDRTLR